MIRFFTVLPNTNTVGAKRKLDDKNTKNIKNGKGKPTAGRGKMGKR